MRKVLAKRRRAVPRRPARRPPLRVTLQSFVVVYPQDPAADTGVVAFQAPDGTWRPLGAIDPSRIAGLRPKALALAESLLAQVPVPVKVIRYTVRVDVEAPEEGAKS